MQYGYSILCLDSENAYFHAEEDEEVYCWPPKEWVKMYHVRGAAIALLAIRNDDFYVSGSNLELAWLQENLGARLKLKPAEPMVPGSQYSHLRATSFGIDANTMHTAPRETYVKNVLDILGLGDNKCKPMPTPMVQTREKSDQDERRLGDEDRRAYHRWVGILRHLLKYRPDIAFTVREVSKTLASPEDADLRRLLGKYLLGTQKLGIMIGKSYDPEHIDAYTDADWSGDSINRKNISGGILETGYSNIERVHERSELSNVIERRERALRCGVDNSRGLAPPPISGILGTAAEAPIENRFDSGPRHHPEARVRTSQTHGNETFVASCETRGEKVDGDQGTNANEHC